MAIRNITGVLKDISGNPVVTPLTFQSEGFNSVDGGFIPPGKVTVEPDENGHFDFTLVDGTYKVAGFIDGAKVNLFAKVTPSGPWDVSSIFTNKEKITEDTLSQVRNLVSYALSHKVLRSPSGKTFKLSVDNEGNLSTEEFP
jgi:hypothetical protein